MSWRNGMLDERMETQNKKRIRPRPQEDEEMEEEMDRPKFVPLNRSKSIFDQDAGKNFGGINTAPSVFDRQAVIRTDA